MQVHKCIMESGMLPDLKAKNALVDMYTIVARWKQLWEFSEGMQVRNVVVLDVRNL
jgi:hypothetical protein